MNERIKELAAQAGLDAKEIRDDESLTLYAFEEFDLERFADLVRQDEREACAVACEYYGSPFNSHRITECVNAIRARSKHD